MRNKLLATLVCSALAVTAAIPTAAMAERHKVQVCRDVSSRGARNTGTVLGAVGGGLIGNSVSKGGGGALVGAGLGAVAGHQIAKHNDTHRKCHWEWRD
ncbi:glycine zipper domain-containing protein [Phenylobacterium sp.]|uniref:glycine zipper domain-containing protein n=1 Tax=Phenylobacterium sp. TaxID=1871053 RepID=UPI0025E6C869|nr:glycine zipper domain-containing protein [Phenylobacterium sp.]